jgi:hypothetical protein
MNRPMKKILTLSLIASAICLIPTANTYAKWQELGSNPAMTVYIDMDTATAEGNKAQVMSMLDLKKPGKNPKTNEAVSSLVGLNQYDCSNTTYRPIEFKEFAGNKGSGKVVSDNKTPDSSFEAIPNESWTAGVFNVVCPKK